MQTTLPEQFENIRLTRADCFPITSLPYASARAEAVAKIITDSGVCVLEDFFQEHELAAIGEEYLQTLARGKSQLNPYWHYVETPTQHQAHGVDKLDPNDPMLLKGGRVRPAIGLPRHCQLNQVLECAFLQQLAATYFGATPYRYPVRIQFVKTMQFAKGASHQIPFVPHADRQRFLKFFIYLNEMDLVYVMSMALGNPCAIRCSRIRRRMASSCTSPWPMRKTVGVRSSSPSHTSAASQRATPRPAWRPLAMLALSK